MLVIFLLQIGIALAQSGNSANSNAASAPVSQTNTIQDAANVQNTGSDKNVQRATTNGIAAVVNFMSLNIPGAFYYGVDAWNSYMSSKDMDKLAAKNNQNKSTLSSITGDNTGGGSSAADASNGKVYMRRVDPKFLYEGPNKELGDYFEKKTGMKREQFLAEIYNADKMWVDGVPPIEIWKKYKEPLLSIVPFAPLRDFLEKRAETVAIPWLQNTSHYLPTLTGLPSEFSSQCAILKLSGEKGDSEKCKEVDKDNEKLLASIPDPTPSMDALAAAVATGNPANPNVNPAPSTAAQAERNPSAVSATKIAIKESKTILGLQGNDESALGELYGDDKAMANRSLFERVSQKYKKLPEYLHQAFYAPK